jgi:hypothetical protein
MTDPVKAVDFVVAQRRTLLVSLQFGGEHKILGRPFQRL